MTADRYRQQLRAALDAVTVQPSRGHTWFGAAVEPLPRELRQAVAVATLRDELCRQLRERLYTSFYVCGGPRRAEPAAPGRPTRDDALVAALSAANRCRGGWQSGWQICSPPADDGQLLARRDGLTLRLHRVEVEAVDGSEPGPGTAVRIRFPREQRRISPGFYMAHGEAELRCRRPQDVTRLYWNLAPTDRDAAVTRMAERTTRLRDDAVPFQLKIMDRADQPARCDRAVLYLHRDDWARALPALQDTYRRVGPRLRPATPALTRILAPGLGLAENPAKGSFGKHRCRLLAEALFEAHDRGAQTTDARLHIVEECLNRQGIRLAAPFLDPATADDPYRGFAAALPATRATPPAPRTMAAATRATPETLLAAGLGIAHLLARTAIRHGDRCTWLGPESAAPDAALVTLDAGIYRGAAGVALFLGEAARLGEHDALRTAALGAARQALARTADTPPPGRSWGLHSGHLGTALAVARVGSVLGEPALRAGAIRLVEQVATQAARDSADGEGDSEFDVIGGLAGGVLGLCALHRLLGAGPYRTRARELGDQLLRTARRSAAGLSWRSPHHGAAPDLTGYSHGTAGVAHALLELHALGGGARFAAAARDAIAYEQHWFDPAAGNWPDFRDAARGARSLPTMTAWCHGAPGIALSRLRAWQLLGDQAAHHTAQLALATTRAAVRRQLERPDLDGDLGLCHGLLGNADVLLEGERVLPATAGTGGEVWIAARRAAERCADPDVTMRVLERQGPGLLTGLAGMGYFFLRCADARTPSVLAVTPAGFGAR